MAPSFNNLVEKLRADQLTWRHKRLGEVKGDGKWAGRSYPFILPRSARERNLWPGIQESGRFPLSEHLTANKIQAHKGRDHLLSSWTLCANLYFPFGQDDRGKDLAAGFLREKVDPRIHQVTAVELEYEDPEEALKPRELLGEPGGNRGANQTSPDVCFLVELEDGTPGAVLTEVKFTEHSFYDCSALRKRKKARRQEPCSDMARLLQSPQMMCPQHLDLGRRYWDHLAGVFNGQGLSRCPAVSGGYQLLRQQALAEGLAGSGKYGLVVSAVAWDHRNTWLMESVKKAGIKRVDQDWADLFRGKAPFRAFSHQEWVAWVRSKGGGPSDWCKDWLVYMEDRYGY